EEEYSSCCHQPLSHPRPIAGRLHVRGELGRQFRAEILDQLLSFGEWDTRLDQPVFRTAMLLPEPQRILDLGPYAVELAAPLGGLARPRPTRQDRIVRQPYRRPSRRIRAGDQD